MDLTNKQRAAMDWLCLRDDLFPTFSKYPVIRFSDRDNNIVKYHIAEIVESYEARELEACR